MGRERGGGGGYPGPTGPTGSIGGCGSGGTTRTTLSNREKIAGPKVHRPLLARQGRLAPSLGGKQKASRNRAQLQLARHHLRVADIRREARAG